MGIVAYLHLFTDTLRDGHGGDTTRLGATDDAKVTIAVLVQELRELGRFAGAGLADDDDHYMVLN